MTIGEVYSLARVVGFPPAAALKAVAIALKESGLNPGAFNGSGPDHSFGLMQINMLGAMGAERRRAWGLSSDDQLFDAETNMRAAYSLWSGNDSNFNRHWAIDSVDRGVYQSALTTVQATVSDAAASMPYPAITGGWPTVPDEFGEMGVKVAAFIGTVVLLDLILG